MNTVNVTGALWYISETSVPELTRIRVFDFGYDRNTVCQLQGGGTLDPRVVIESAKLGTLIVYVPVDTPKRNYVYTPDDSAFKTALTLLVIVGITVAIIGRR